MLNFIIFAAGMFAGFLAYKLILMLRKRAVCKNAEINPEHSAVEKDDADDSKRRGSFLKMILDFIPCQVFIKDPIDAFRYKLANRNFLDYYKLNECDVVGHPDMDIFELDVAKQLRSHDKEVCDDFGKVFRFDEDISFMRKENEIFQSLKVAFNSPDGHPYMLGVCVDITEMIKMEKGRDVIKHCLEDLVLGKDINECIDKAIKATTEYIKASKTFIMHFDSEKKTVSCVREYYQAGTHRILDTLKDVPSSTNSDLEKHYETECFMTFPDLQSIDLIDKFGNFYADIIKKNDYRSLYCHRLRVDEKLWGYVGIAYAKNKRILNDNELEFVQSAARFMELMIRHKNTQEKLQNAIEESRAADKAKSRFLATMSHEIRTPLNAIIGYSDLLRDASDLPSKEKQDYLNGISIAGNALLALINDILDLSKLEAGKMQFANVATNLPDLTNEVMTIFHQKISEKNLECKIDAKTMPLIRIDALRFKQILFNLIGNAVKFTTKGGITVSESFEKVDNSTGTLHISIKDTGCGISKTDSENLFKPFEQSRGMIGTAIANKGTGLGLAIVRKMLEYMGGEISLESQPNVGSTFSIEMRKVKFEKNAPKTAELDPASLPDEKLPSFEVLVVDDVAMNLSVMRAILKNLKINSATANNGENALAMLEKKPFDIILTDLWMPDMNGAELAQRIRKCGKYQKLSIIALTADTEASTDFDTSVFDFIISKPVTIEKLKDVLLKCK